MSGRHGSLLKLVERVVGPRVREEFVGGVDFILSSQFLKLVEFPDSFVQVVVAFGMGLPSSDDISNYCCYELVEEHILTDSHKQNLGLELWVRFKDIFFVLGSDTHKA